jgi:hypothetical protein
MQSNYESFIQNIQLIIPRENGGTLPDGYDTSHLWQYSVGLFNEHKGVIESLLCLGYVPDIIFLRETLSGEHPIIHMYETEKFKESYWSAKSDLIPSVTFIKDQQDESKTIPIIRLEFGNTGIAGID